MKHKKAAVLFLLFACVLTAVAMANTPEKRTIRYFNNHRAALESDISNSVETGRAVSGVDVTFNYWDGEHPIMEYIVVSRGIGSASRYYGFFYSFDNKPASFQNANEPLAPVSEKAWEWRGDGDNHGIVRRLDGNWFYFEASL